MMTLFERDIPPTVRVFNLSLSRQERKKVRDLPVETDQRVVPVTIRDLHLDIERRQNASACCVLSKLNVGRPLDPNILVNGSTALSLAIYQGCDDIVEMLLEKPWEHSCDWRKKPVDVNKLSRDRLQRVETPLVTACRLGNLKVVELLVDRGADLERLDGENRTALWMATHQRNLDIVSFLVRQGASVNPSPLWFRSPIFAAFRTALRSVAIIKVLVRHGAETNLYPQRRPHLGTLAVQAGHESRFLIQLLFEAGYDFQKYAPSSDECSAYAAALADDEIIIPSSSDEVGGFLWSPLTLRQMCIRTVRSTVAESCGGKEFKSSIRRLPVPVLIQKDLLLLHISCDRLVHFRN